MKLIQEYREIFKKEGVVFSYETKNTNFPYQASITFPEGNVIGLKGRKSKGVFYLHPMENTDFKKASEEEMKYLKKLVNFFESLAKEKEQPNMFVYKETFEKLVPKEMIEEIFSPSKYEEISPEIAYRLQQKGELLVSTIGWVSIGSGKNVYAHTKMCKTMNKLVREYHKKEKTFSFNWHPIGRSDVYNYHFMGHNGNLEVVLTLEEKVILYDGKLPFSLKVELEKIEEGFEKLIESIVKKRKVKAIFEPSSYYFDRMARINMSMFKTSFVKEVYELLKDKYGAILLEEQCAENIKDTTYFSFGEMHFQLFNIGNDVFVVNGKKEEIIFHTELDKRIEAFQFYKKNVS